MDMDRKWQGKFIKCVYWHIPQVCEKYYISTFKKYLDISKKSLAVHKFFDCYEIILLSIKKVNPLRAVFCVGKTFLYR